VKKKDSGWGKIAAMRLFDGLYGEMGISERILIELIETKPLQRLKRIAQYGVPDDYYHLVNYSRYTHSVGVMLLLRMMGATLEEQVAGLLHDVSHTAFSHVVDWVVGDGKTENYQDEQHDQRLSQSEIPAILERYGFSPKRITDYHWFGLLEQEAPDICADRVDYALREIPIETAKQILVKLRVREGKMVMEDRASAEEFARAYLKLQIEHWGGFEATSRYRLFANVIREAMNKKIVTMNDFWEDDDYVMRKILTANDKHISSQLESLRSRSLKGYPISGLVVYKKFRYIDPLFMDGDKLKRVSEVDEDFCLEIERARLKNQKWVRIAKIEQ